ncbi:MAG TPA: S8 family serine peptidase [Bryobacteraceae bacterium]|nr:S8 family serine peptidase [Bryobacteraceae bacterium]
MLLKAFRRGLDCAIAVAFTLVPLSAQFVPDRYILLLEDPPVTSRFATREELRSAPAGAYRAQIETRQRSVRSELAARQIPVSGAVSTVLNAIFVNVPASRVPELLAIPGVAAVRPMRRYHANLNRATQLMNAPAAWAQVGGQSNAGAGIKIGIIDSGLDDTHPAFQDSSLTAPNGYPKCSESCSYTSNKIIVSRSYVRQLAGFTSKDPVNNPDDTSIPPPPATSSPDDYTPRDHLGHGTGVASVAAGNQNTGTVTFTGMAPKAYLGIYKIAGTPGVNDGPTDQILIMAIDDALNDGMDIASLSWGGQALTGALDVGPVCGNPVNMPCDPTAFAYEAAAKAGLVITVAGGNSGSDANTYPFLNSISSPSNAPSVIGVGATTSSHVLTPAVTVNAASAPSSVKGIAAQLTDATFYPAYQGAALAPLIDVDTLNNDPYACSTLPENSLQGSFALIERGTTTAGSCLLTQKADNAAAAGAIGIVFYMPDATPPTIVAPGFTFNGPIVIISNADGVNLKNYIDANPGQMATIDTAGLETELAAYNANEGISPPVLPNLLASYSSYGPTPDGALKPDLVATGGLDPIIAFSSGLYMAGQRLDPSGDLYSENGYVAADGTSFAAPMTAGAAALIKQAHPNFNAADIKSALVNSAVTITTDDQGNPVDAEGVGAGRLDVGAAINASVTVKPTSVSLGFVKAASALPVKQTFVLTNRASSSVSLSLAVAPNSTLNSTTVAVDKTGFTLAPGDAAAQTITVTLSGSLPASGEYSGMVKVTGANVALNIPYLFIVPDGIPYNVVWVSDFGDVQGIPGADGGTVGVQVVDQFGAPVTGAPVAFSAQQGQLTFQTVDEEPACSPNNTNNVTCNTDGYGFAYAEVFLGSTPGVDPAITAHVGTMPPLMTNAFILPVPSITADQVLNNASFQPAIAPGSIVAIKGSNIMDTELLVNLLQGYDVANTSPFPLALDAVSVSFDVPSAGLSLAAPIVAVSQNQINVQVPWELQGQTSAQLKVTIDEEFGIPIRSNVITVPIASSAPAFYLYNNTNTPDALDTNYHIVTSSNPAVRGQFIMLYANALGPVANTPADGAPGDNTTLTTTVPVVMIGGQPATVQYHGLAPGFAGVYQVNVQVPTNIAPGNQPITIAIGANTSPSQTGGANPQTIMIAVQ